MIINDYDKKTVALADELYRHDTMLDDVRNANEGVQKPYLERAEFLQNSSWMTDHNKTLQHAAWVEGCEAGDGDGNLSSREREEMSPYAD
ncbi:hypothetical protein LG293_16115 (plasmid) [Citricoccus nitrophenolicus]